MSTIPTLDPVQSVVQGVVEAAVGKLIDAVDRHFAPPARADRWLRTPAARAGLRMAMLAALESTAEHADPAAMRFFDLTLLAQPETAETLAGLLLPTRRRSQAEVSAGLVAAWQTHYADPAQAEAQAMRPVTDLFVETLVAELRLATPFRELLDSRTLAEVAAALAAQGDAATQRHTDITAALARLEAILLWLQAQTQPAAGAAAPTTRRTFSVEGERPENLGEIGFLSQRPLAADGVLYVGSRDRTIHAWQLAGGAALWRTPLPAGYQMPEAFALWRDLLLVSPQIIEYDAQHKDLLLLDRRSGAIAGSVPLPERQMGAALVVDDMAYLAGAAGTLYAVDLAARAVAWRLPLGLSLSPYPPVLAAAQTLLLPANDASLRAVDLATRQLAWRFTATGSTAHFVPSPVLDGDTVLAANWNGVLYALDAATGEERWRYSVPEQPGRNRTLNHSPVVAGAAVLVGSYDHRVHAVDRRSGDLRWISPDLGRRIYSRPAVAGSGSQALVYVTPYRRHLHALRLEDGQLAWPEAAELAERGRCDLLVAGNLLVAGGHQGTVELLPVAAPVQDAADLLAAGDWATAAWQLSEAGRLGEAADLYAEHQLFYRAARLYRQAGKLTAAADAFAHDEHHPPSWREAARLYQEMAAFDHAAVQYERLAEWPAAAQAWETAGNLARAAAIYAEPLGETQHAVELYVAAGQPLAAAALLEQAGNLSAARKVLEAAGEELYAAEISRLLREAVRGGLTDARADALRRATSPQARAGVYEDAGEWTKAAEAWVEAGDWARGVDLLLAHDRLDTALKLLLERSEPAAQRQAAALLAKAGRFAEALPLYEQLRDAAGQVACLRGLQQWDPAADLCRKQAEGGEGPHLDPAAQAAVAGWYDEAAALYKLAGRMVACQNCRQKARYLRNLPWLTPSFHADKPLERGAANVVRVIVANESSGPARDVTVELRHDSGHVRFTNFPPLRMLPALEHSERRVELRADEHGSLLVRVFVHWTNPDGRRQTVEMQEWQANILNPDELRAGPTVVHVQGDYLQRGEIYHGSVYRDQSYHQEGDRVDISRRAGGDAPPVGRRCPACSHVNPTAAAYCDGCGEKMEPS